MRTYSVNPPPTADLKRPPAPQRSAGIRGAPKAYRVGNANDPKDDDAQFDDEHAAIDAAQALANGERWANFETPYAVWDRRGDIVHLFFRGQQFRAV